MEFFNCTSQSTKLTREGCGKRHAAAIGKPIRTSLGGIAPKLIAGTCAGCTVGAAHARGETPARWPDGSPIVLVSLSPRPAERSRLGRPRTSSADVGGAPRAAERRRRAA